MSYPEYEKVRMGYIPATVRSVLLTFFATCTIFLSTAVYLQANSQMLINVAGIQIAQPDYLSEIAEKK